MDNMYEDMHYGLMSIDKICKFIPYKIIFDCEFEYNRCVIFCATLSLYKELLQKA